MRKFKIRGHQCEPCSQWQKRAEDSIQELKRIWKRRMIKRISPKRVLDFGMVYESKKGSHTEVISLIELFVPFLPEAFMRLFSWIRYVFIDESLELRFS